MKIVLAVFSIFQLTTLHTFAEDRNDDFWAPLLKAARNPDLSDATRWISKESDLYFSGQIKRGDCKKASSLISTTHSRFIVNSTGGNVEEALCITKEVNKFKPLSTIVRGICWSSCANYFFLGSQTPTIDFGTVGFHGNVTAILHSDFYLDAYEKLKNGERLSSETTKQILLYLGVQDGNDELSVQQISRFIKSIETLKQLSQKEQSFLRQNNLSQQLFDDSFEYDKGSVDGKMYSFLIPSPGTFEKYGIMKVIGENDSRFVEYYNSANRGQLLYR